MTDKTPFTDGELDDLFAAARDAAPVPSDALMARVLADADIVMAEQAAPAPAPQVAPAQGLWERLSAAVGGWPALAGLATATATGLVIGFASPDALEVWSSDYLLSLEGDTIDDFIPSFDGLYDEG